MKKSKSIFSILISFCLSMSIIHGQSEGTYTIESVSKKGEFLGLRDGIIEEYATVETHRNKSSFAKSIRWQLKDAGDGYFFIIKKDENLALSLYANSTKRNNSLRLVKFRNSNYFKFKLKRVGRDQYQIINKQTPKYFITNSGRNRVRNGSIRSTATYWKLTETTELATNNNTRSNSNYSGTNNRRNSGFGNNGINRNAIQHQSIPKSLEDGRLIFEAFVPESPQRRTHQGKSLHDHHYILAKVDYGFGFGAEVSSIAKTNDADIFMRLRPTNDGYYRISCGSAYLICHSGLSFTSDANRASLFTFRKKGSGYLMIPKDYPKKCVAIKNSERRKVNLQGRRCPSLNTSLSDFDSPAAIAWKIQKNETPIRGYGVSINSITVIEESDPGSEIELIGIIHVISRDQNTGRKVREKCFEIRSQLDLEEGQSWRGQAIQGVIERSLNFISTEELMMYDGHFIELDLSDFFELDGLKNDTFSPTTDIWRWGDGLKKSTFEAGGNVIEIEWGVSPNLTGEWGSSY